MALRRSLVFAVLVVFLASTLPAQPAAAHLDDRDGDALTATIIGHDIRPIGLSPDDFHGSYDYPSKAIRVEFKIVYDEHPEIEPAKKAFRAWYQLREAAGSKFLDTPTLREKLDADAFEKGRIEPESDQYYDDPKTWHQTGLGFKKERAEPFSLWTHQECTQAEKITLEGEVFEMSFKTAWTGEGLGYVPLPGAGIGAKAAKIFGSKIAKGLGYHGSLIASGKIILEPGTNVLSMKYTDGSAKSFEVDIQLTDEYLKVPCEDVEDDWWKKTAYYLPSPKLDKLPASALLYASYLAEQDRANRLRPEPGNPLGWTGRDLAIAQADARAETAALAALDAFVVLRDGANTDALAAYEAGIELLDADPAAATRAFALAVKEQSGGPVGDMRPVGFSTLLTPLLEGEDGAIVFSVGNNVSAASALTPTRELAAGLEDDAMAVPIVLTHVPRPTETDAGSEAELPYHIVAFCGSELFSSPCSEPVEFDGETESINWTAGESAGTDLQEHALSGPGLAALSGRDTDVVLGTTRIHTVPDEGPPLVDRPSVIDWIHQVHEAIPYGSEVPRFATAVFGTRVIAEARLVDGSILTGRVGLAGSDGFSPEHITLTTPALSDQQDILPWRVDPQANVVATAHVKTRDDVITRIMQDPDPETGFRRALATGELEVEANGGLISSVATQTVTMTARIQTRFEPRPFDVESDEKRGADLLGTPVTLRRNAIGHVIAEATAPSGTRGDSPASWGSSPTGMRASTPPPATIQFVIDPNLPEESPGLYRGWTTPSMQQLLDTPPAGSRWQPSPNAGLLDLNTWHSYLRCIDCMGPEQKLAPEASS